MPPLVSAREITVRFDRPILDGVSLSLSPGECLSITGPSGTGKSVLLRAMVGLIPHTGEVCLQGRPLDSLPPWEARTRLLYVAQTPPRLPGTLWDNLDAVRRLTAVRARAAPEAQVRAWLAALGLAGREEAPASTLSGGEAQRMGLVRALQVQPQVLLLDEPTASLDAAAAAAVRDVITEWLRPDRGVIWVSHDLSRLGGLAHRNFPLGAP